MEDADKKEKAEYGQHQRENNATCDSPPDGEERKKVEKESPEEKGQNQRIQTRARAPPQASQPCVNMFLSVCLHTDKTLHTHVHAPLDASVSFRDRDPRAQHQQQREDRDFSPHVTPK